MVAGRSLTGYADYDFQILGVSCIPRPLAEYRVHQYIPNKLYTRAALGRLGASAEVLKSAPQSARSNTTECRHRVQIHSEKLYTVGRDAVQQSANRVQDSIKLYTRYDVRDAVQQSADTECRYIPKSCTP